MAERTPGEGGRDEVVVPPPARLQQATAFRSTWLESSLRALRTRGLMDRYFAALPARFHEDVRSSVAGTWLPIEVALAHYETLDGMGFTDEEILTIGREVSARYHNNMISMLLTLARTVGVTPWVVLKHAPKSWERTWRGGAVAVYRSGPTDAWYELLGWPCARIHYVRVGMRAMAEVLGGMFCKRMTVRELTDRASPTSLAFRLTWV